MTNIRLTTSMYDDLKFCPFCGSELVSFGDDMKRCGFHIAVKRGNIEEEDIYGA